MDQSLRPIDGSGSLLAESNHSESQPQPADAAAACNPNSDGTSKNIVASSSSQMHFQVATTTPNTTKPMLPDTREQRTCFPAKVRMCINCTNAAGLASLPSTDFDFEYNVTMLPDFLPSFPEDHFLKWLSPTQPFTTGDILDVTGVSLDSPDVQPAMDHQTLELWKENLTRPACSEDTVECTATTTRSTKPQNGINIGVQAYKDSIWCYNPSQKDQWKLKVAQLSGSPQSIDDLASEVQSPSDGPTSDAISDATRNTIIALLISLLDHTSSKEIAYFMSQFPSAELLTTLMNRFLANHAKDIDAYIHLPTFNPNQQTLELLLGMIASAALSCSHLRVHNFGSSLHDAQFELSARMV